MLSRYLLLFSNGELRTVYNQEKQEFYKKAIPIIAALLLVLSLILEILFRSMNYGDQTVATSIINWGVSFIFVGMAILIRHFIWVSWLVCPLLTLLAYYYFAFVDY
jgi:hypothetical protein